MTTLKSLTPLQILPPEQPMTDVEGVNIGATTPGTGNFTSLSTTGNATFGAAVQSTNIVAGQTVTITQPVSGTVYQNTNDFEITLYVPITYTTGGTVSTCAVALGSASSPTTLYTNSRPATAVAGEIATEKLTVPPKWYYSFTTSNATIGTASAIAGLK